MISKASYQNPIIQSVHCVFTVMKLTLVLSDSLGSLDQSTPLGSGWLVAASESCEVRHRWAPGAINQKKGKK